MPLVNVGPLDSLPSGTIKEIERGDAAYAVCNVEGKLYCIDGTCPHAGGPLGQGTMNGNYLVCPWHAFEFDCRTGLNEEDQDLRVQTFPVTVKEGQILIELP